MYSIPREKKKEKGAVEGTNEAKEQARSKSLHLGLPPRPTCASIDSPTTTSGIRLTLEILILYYSAEQSLPSHRRPCRLMVVVIVVAFGRSDSRHRRRRRNHKRKELETVTAGTECISFG